jgi:hypothetical protein
MTEEKSREIIELQKMRFEFAWRYFDFHARQRTTMFNFFILLLPFLFGGIFLNLKGGQWSVAPLHCHRCLDHWFCIERCLFFCSIFETGA